VDDLGASLARFMELFREARNTKFSHAHPAVSALKACASDIESLAPSSLRDAVVRPSVGQGNWAAVPWIAVLHPDVTTTTQHGVYPVLLFAEDLAAVEVTIAQGVTNLKRSLGRRSAVEELDRRATLLRTHFEEMKGFGFGLETELDLGRSVLARDYVASTVVHRRYEIGTLAESNVSEAVAALLASYGRLVQSDLLRTLSPKDEVEVPPRALMVYVGRSADANFESGGRAGWWGWKQAPSGLEALRPGHLVAFGRGFNGGSPRVDAGDWASHHLREVVVGRVIEAPGRTDRLVMPDEITGEAAYPWKLRFEILGAEDHVPLTAGDRLSESGSEALRLSAINRGVGRLVPVSGSPLLEEFMAGADTAGQVEPVDLRSASEAFAAAVEDSGLRLAAGDALAFFAAVATKPFVILTGQSGSGKTQLAMKLGEWFGSDDLGRPRSLVVPVRPDWTGPEFLFGYPDALRSSGGREVWAVPDALEFVLRAIEEPREPYLLLLDEMNLAHVERYFADFLSGAESRQPVVPELTRQDGEWVATGNTQRLPLPRNLVVAGTVNVDETTYLFSPKVLDRAFTFEFRTSSEDLDPTLRRPSALAPADRIHRQAVVRTLLDDEWQHAHPSGEADALAEDLRALHTKLSPSGHDFGHRVLHESLRYAALLEAVGVDGRWAVLDRIVLTKLLPKMHGTRSRVETPLRELRKFASGDGGEGAPAAMPLAARKLDRMLAVLVEAQFVSFTE